MARAPALPPSGIPSGFVVRPSMRSPKWVSWFLDTNGDGTGTKDASVNGSVTPVVFKVYPPQTGVLTVHLMIFQLVDNGVFSADDYGSSGAPLTNGILVEHTNGSDTIDMLDGLTIKSNGQWARYCYDLNLTSFGSGNDFLEGRWDFNSAGVPIILDQGDELRVTVQDDLTSLVSHFFCVQGYVTDYTR